MTIGMEVTDNERVQLTEQNYRSLCRLCLRADDDCIVDVFSRCGGNAAKQPLIDRLNDLYQVKVKQIRHILSIIQIAIKKSYSLNNF